MGTITEVYKYDLTPTYEPVIIDSNKLLQGLSTDATSIDFNKIDMSYFMEKIGCNRSYSEILDCVERTIAIIV
jgi:hypothetical protein